MHCPQDCLMRAPSETSQWTQRNCFPASEICRPQSERLLRNPHRKCSRLATSVLLISNGPLQYMQHQAQQPSMYVDTSTALCKFGTYFWRNFLTTTSCVVPPMTHVQFTPSPKGLVRSFQADVASAQLRLNGCNFWCRRCCERLCGTFGLGCLAPRTASRQV